MLDIYGLIFLFNDHLFICTGYISHLKQYLETFFFFLAMLLYILWINGYYYYYRSCDLFIQVCTTVYVYSWILTDNLTTWEATWRCRFSYLTVTECQSWDDSCPELFLAFFFFWIENFFWLYFHLIDSCTCCNGWGSLSQERKGLHEQNVFVVIIIKKKNTRNDSV